MYSLEKNDVRSSECLTELNIYIYNLKSYKIMAQLM